ncbi:Kelch repeat-containing protein [Sorangium sp. So ce124]|uniref:Kelch repeat-containing protein n=1 Tax=Sorangium sp. So ce124 TaxID=3133280 RepID=UPI003F5DED46
MRGSFFAASSGSRWIGGLAIGAIALSSWTWAAAGCSDQGEGEPGAALRGRSPDRHQLVLEDGTGFARTADGFAPRAGEDAGGGARVAPGWTSASGMLVPRAYHAATLLHDGRVLVAGGARSDKDPCTTAAELYDPATNTWSPAAPMRGGRCWPGAVLLEDGRVLVAGGHSRYERVEGDLGVGSAEIYDPATDTWALAAPMLAARTSDVMDQLVVLLPDGRVFVTAGIDEESRNAEIYDPDADAWTLTSPMLGAITAGEFATVESATLLLDGRVLVAGGGYDTSGDWQLAAEIYDPAADAWTAAAAANSGRTSLTATRLLDGKVLFVGTNGRVRDMQVNTADIYDPVSDTWTMEAGPGGFEGPLHLGGGNGGHRASLLSDGRVIETGGSLADWFWCGTSACGSDYGRIDFDMAQVYDPATSTWSWLPPMRLERSWHSSTRLLDGRVLVAGGRYWTPEWGRPESFTATASTELFLAPGTQGASCASSTECGGRPCVDGVCCDAACDGTCEACSVAAGAARDGTCGPTTGTRCDDGDTCTEADTCQAGVCVGVPGDVGSCHGGGGGSTSSGAGGDGSVSSSSSGAGGSGGGGSTSSGAGGDDAAASATSSSGSGGAGGAGSAASSSSVGGDDAAASATSSSGSGGAGGAGSAASSSSVGGDDAAASATSSSGAGGAGGDAASSTSASSASASNGGGGSSSATAASSSSGAGSSGDTGVATTGSASSGADADSPDRSSSGCSTNGDPTSTGTTASSAWLGVLGLLCWSRRRSLTGKRHPPSPRRPPFRSRSASSTS